MQKIQDGTCDMQVKDMVDVDELSSESRKQLKKQSKRVQKEAAKLRAQARRLREAQNAEVQERKKLLGQVAETSRDWGQRVVERGNDLATTGMTLAGDQLRVGQQKAREYGSNLMQGVNQLSNQTTQNLSDWGGNASSRLLRQGQQLGQNAADWSDETSYRLRKQGKRLAQNTADWGDETAHRLRRQSRSLFQTLADWGDETLYRLRRQGRNLSRNLFDRKEDAARQLARQKRSLGRSFVDTREDAVRQMRRQGRSLSRNFADRRDDTVRQMRKQRDYLSERGGQLIEPVRRSKAWSILGFVSGLALAGGLTYWLVKRAVERNLTTREEEAGIELDTSEPLNGVAYRPDTEVRAASQGDTLVATRVATSASPTTRFVGVVSSKRYYPLGLNPDVQDLVYFDREEDARAEGFSAAE
jgi:gas vesicle protein